mgnify:CR=1 FL=1
MSIRFNRSRELIKKILEEPELGKEIIVSGWVQLLRKQPPIHFIQLNDGSTVKNLQIVVTEDFQQQEMLKLITRGCSIKVTGVLITSPKPEQPYELQATNITILGKSDPKYPINKQARSLDYLRTIEHMRIRTPVMKAVHRIRNTLAFAIHEYFQGIGCQYVHTPVITSNDCEGAGETFTITTQYPKDEKPHPMYKKKELFKEPTFLTVSGQLHGESYAMGLGDIYTFGPTFRAENSNTSRHLNEFWMIEPELSFINQEDLHNLSEDFVKYCVSMVLEKNMDELELLNKRDEDLLNRLKVISEMKFVRLTYKEALDILKDSYEKTEEDDDIEFGLDLSSAMEKHLTDNVFKRPVMLYNYPKCIKSFYMKSNEEETETTVQAMDMLVPGIGELIGGSIREDDFEKLEKIVKEKGITNLSWYLDLRKYGSVPHGGFGLGFERLVLLCTGMTNIRDVIPYPRYPKHVFA